MEHGIAGADPIEAARPCRGHGDRRRRRPTEAGPSGPGWHRLRRYRERRGVDEFIRGADTVHGQLDRFRLVGRQVEPNLTTLAHGGDGGITSYGHGDIL